MDDIDEFMEILLKGDRNTIDEYIKSGKFKTRELEPRLNTVPVRDSHSPEKQSSMHPCERKGTDYVEKYQNQLENNNLSKSFKSLDLTGLSSIPSSQFPVRDETDDETDGEECNEPAYLKYYRKDLPILKHRKSIINDIKSYPVTIISGHTGCGKSTQIPQYIYDDCMENKMPCNILITQPRRVAAITVAQRVAFERNSPLGKIVGYQVGLDKRVEELTEASTQITYCTTGVVIQKLIANKNMSRYSHIIIDEVHERDIEIDFLLIIIRRFLMTHSANTKIILMSATMNIEQFYEFFKLPLDDDAYPYPKKINFQNLQRKHTIKEYYLEDIENLLKTTQQSEVFNLKEAQIDKPEINTEMYTFAAKLAMMLMSSAYSTDFNNPKMAYKGGNLLVFLPGIHEIENFQQELDHQVKLISANKWFTFEIHILHSSLSTEEQKAAFVDNEKAKIILSTNIAESSVTIPKIAYVIDFCLTKYHKRFENSQISTLTLDWASKNNCQQRAGRAGRVCKGSVYRLVSKRFYQMQMREFSIPEMQRAPLESVILKIKKLDMGKPLEILALAMDPPDESSVVNAILTLKELGGLFIYNNNGDFEYDDGDMTFIGEIMSALPIDVRISKLIILGYLYSILDEAVIIGAGLSVKGIFFNSLGLNKMKAYEAKLEMAQGSASDCIAILNTYTAWQNFKKNRKIQSEASWCAQQCLDLKNLNEMRLLIEEITKRLRPYKIENLPSGKQPVWNLNEKKLIIKIVLAGAFGVSNFFVQDPSLIVERDAFSVTNNSDIFRTVYYRKMNSQTYGPIYENQIKNFLVKRGVCETNAKINVKFDYNSSEHVFLTFEDHSNKGDLKKRFGKVPLEIYRALKLRNLGEKLVLSVMNITETIKFAAANGYGELNESNFVPRIEYIQHPELCVLPTPFHTKMKGYVVYVDNCNKFFFRPHIACGDKLKEQDCHYDQDYGYICNLMNNANLQPAKEYLIGDLVIIQKIASCKQRGIVVKSSPEGTAIINFIDFGYTIELPKTNVFEFVKKDDPIKAELLKYHSRVFECRLKDIQPSMLQSYEGEWTLAANKEFSDNVINKKAVINIFSVVDDIVAVELKTIQKPVNINWNQKLVADGHAQFCEESYISKLNNATRAHIRSSNTIAYGPATAFQNKVDKLMSTERKYVPICGEPNKLQKIVLQGPFSSLEAKIYGVSRGFGCSLSIDGASINNVFLSDDFLDFHKKFLVAGEVAMTPDKRYGKVRETTIMPNFPGLPVLLALIFAPNLELKCDEEKTRFVSILAGLGFDTDIQKPFFEDRDASLNIDFDLAADDITEINHLRFMMSSLMYTTPFKQFPDIFDGQRETFLTKIKYLIMKILNKKRQPREIQHCGENFQWNFNREDAKSFTDPMIGRAVFKPISIPKLTEVPIEMKQKLLKEVEELEKSLFKTGTVNKHCPLCDVYWTGDTELKLHLMSRMHILRKEQLKN